MIINPKDHFIDVICQYTKEGNIIPMRLRVQDEDGLFKTYSVKSYREKTQAENGKTPYGTIKHGQNWSFECTIQVVNKILTVELFFNGKDNLWKVISVN